MFSVTVRRIQIRRINVRGINIHWFYVRRINIRWFYVRRSYEHLAPLSPWLRPRPSTRSILTDPPPHHNGTSRIDPAPAVRHRSPRGEGPVPDGAVFTRIHPYSPGPSAGFVEVHPASVCAGPPPGKMTVGPAVGREFRAVRGTSGTPSPPRSVVRRRTAGLLYCRPAAAVLTALFVHDACPRGPPMAPAAHRLIPFRDGDRVSGKEEPCPSPTMNVWSLSKHV